MTPFRGEEGLGKAFGSFKSIRAIPPLDKAEYYLRLKEFHGVNSVSGLAKITGEDWSYIAKIIRTLDLPESIKDFLRNNKSDPAIL